MVIALTGMAQGPMSCGTNRVQGGLAPEHFQFQVLVPCVSMSGPEGWQAACVRVRLTNLNTGLNVMCQFEIGTPLRTHEMEISRALAQRVSAEQANLAAYAVLSKALLPGMACEQFKAILKGSMPRAIAGARVKADCDPRLVPVEVTREEP
ncbi:hypothetical protein [Cystobacter fuscus]|uniref:hypothetical protein n=1 Tax=Cystobacter fuscus TaxID=43 RepID=UPI0012DEE22F|nr:hypothetical protein [Cystobacter fuscus]